MPYKLSDYHPLWRDVIRPDALRRANYKCQVCGAVNHNKYIVVNGQQTFIDDEFEFNFAKINNYTVKTVHLSVSHNNHNLNDNEPSNLTVRCQRCHLKHDKEYHRVNRLTGNRKKK